MQTQNAEMSVTEERLETLTRALARYRRAFYAQALLVSEVNLTQDLLEEDVIACPQGIEISLTQALGLPVPCCYTTFLDLWSERYVSPENRNDCLQFLAPEALLEKYADGDDRLQISYESIAYIPDKNYVHTMTITFYKNERDDVIAQCTVRDITEQWKQERFLSKELEEMQALNRRLQYVDELTGCANKNGFYQQAEKILQEHPNQIYGIYYSDINNLSYVNNTFGCEAGNRLLQYWSGCLQDTVRDGEVLGRISGDYFAALLRLEDDARQDAIAKEYGEITEKVKMFFQEFDKHFRVEIYTGVYLIMPEDATMISVERMLNRASIAQKSAKQSGKEFAYYNKAQWEKRSREIEICQRLSGAIANGELEAWVQPQYDCHTGKIIGGEILSRWNSPFLGQISPGEFVPALEASGQIYEMDVYIWEQACKYLRKWIDEGMEGIVPLSINISRKDILSGDLKNRLLTLLAKYDLTPNMLPLEITESAYMEEAKLLINTVEELQELGFAIEMDDFGSGYSSLNMLKEVPVDVLKMDLRFLAEGERDKKGGNIISSVIRMAQGLNLLVIAEGVETSDQVSALRNMGCTMMQGYYFARPLPCADFEKLLQTQKTGKMREKVMDTSLQYIYDIMDTNSKSSYIFNHYIGSCAIYEYDGEHLEAMSMNDAFLTEMGDRTGFSRDYMKDGLALVRESDKEKALSAAQKAVATGAAQCEVYIPRTSQWVRVTFRHVVKGRGADYLFCETVNTTEAHNLTAQLNNLSEEVNTQIDMLPTGAFKYEATGEQQFAFISNGLLALLKYPTVEAFQNKFHNRFPEMIWHEDRERVLREIDDQISEIGDKDYCEYRVEMGDGTLKWVYDRGHFVTDDEGKQWFYVVIGDLEEIRNGRSGGFGSAPGETDGADETKK